MVVSAPGRHYSRRCPHTNHNTPAQVTDCLSLPTLPLSAFSVHYACLSSALLIPAFSVSPLAQAKSPLHVTACHCLSHTACHTASPVSLSMSRCLSM